MKNLNPNWNENKFLDDVCHQSKVEFRVYDHDKLGKDFMGEFTLTSQDIIEAEKGTVNKWFTLQKRKKKDVVTGEINIILQMVSKPDPNFNPNTFVAPPPLDAPPPPQDNNSLQTQQTQNTGNTNPPIQNNGFTPPVQQNNGFTPPVQQNNGFTPPPMQNNGTPPLGNNIPPPPRGIIPPPPIRNNQNQTNQDNTTPPQNDTQNVYVPPQRINNTPSQRVYPPQNDTQNVYVPPQNDTQNVYVPPPRINNTQNVYVPPRNNNTQTQRVYNPPQNDTQNVYVPPQNDTQNVPPPRNDNTQFKLPPRTPPPPKTNEIRAIVLYEFAAEQDYELGLTENEEVIILEIQGDWTKGKRVNDGQEGFFPSNYVEIKN